VEAIDEFRKEIKVAVTRNYFLYDRLPTDPTRSAEVVISISGPDPVGTRAVLHAVGEAILRDQAAQRSGRLAQARAFLRMQIAAAHARMESLRNALDQREPSTAPLATDIASRAQIAKLHYEVDVAMEQVFALERRASELAFTAAAEDEQLGLKFELFDETLDAVAPRLTWPQLARRAAIVFVLALLLSTPVVGAFDDRLYAVADLTVRDVPVLGALPRFPGDDVGPYRARSLARV
jgi:hypothetical protein